MRLLYRTQQFLYGVCATALCILAVAGASQATAQTTIYEESFDTGLGSFSGQGRVYTGSYGVRLRGGGSPSAVITSSSIDVSGHSNLSIAYDRATSGLDWSESFTVAYSVDGGAFTTLESSRDAAGRANHSLPDGNSITLRVSLAASSFFESVEVDAVVLEGTADGGNGNDDDDNGDGNGDDNGDGTLPPVDNVDSNGPFQTTEHRNTGPGGDAWVVHPSNMGADGLDHPIFIWGPGAGTGPSNYDFFLDRMASHGFVVYSEVSTGDGDEMEDALDWIIAENSRPGSRYYQQLDTSKIAIGGHSRGSLSAFGVADDPRLTTTVHVAGGSFDGNGPNSLQNPTIYIAGEDDGFATSNIEDDYDNTDVPVFFTIIDNVSHTAAAREGMPAIVAWLRWQLGGEDFRSGDFLDPFCDFCTGPYDSTSKNW